MHYLNKFLQKLTYSKMQLSLLNGTLCILSLLLHYFKRFHRQNNPSNNTEISFFENYIRNRKIWRDISLVHILIIYDTVLLFRISVPIVENHEYNLYLIYPLPFETSQPNKIRFLTPTVKYVIISSVFSKFLFFND